MIWKYLLTETKHNKPEILEGWAYCVIIYLILGKFLPAFDINIFQDSIWAVAVVPGVFAVPLGLNKKGRFFLSTNLPLSLRQIYFSKMLFYLMLISFFAVTVISLELIFNQGYVNKIAVASCFAAIFMVQLYELSNNLKFVMANKSKTSTSGKEVFIAIGMLLLFVSCMVLLVFLSRGVDNTAIRAIAIVSFLLFWICGVGVVDYKVFLKRREYE